MSQARPEPLANTLRLHVDHGTFALDVDLELPGRGICALFGPSGSGKTTLLRAVAGLEPGVRGQLCIAGETWLDSTRGIKLPTHRRPLGMVFQDAALFPHLSVRDNLAFGQRRCGSKGDGAVDTAPVIDLLGLGDLLARRPDTLSGGERQRVAIARALLAAPRLLLMDEPLSALDEARKAEFLPWLERLHAELEIPVLYVSHALAEVARLADHLVLLDQGRALASGPLGEVLPRLDLPLAQGEEAFVVLHARLADYDPAHALARLDFAGGSLWTVSPPRPAGSALRLRVQARDVSLALSPRHDSSILNTLPATLTALEPCGPGRMLARLNAGGAALLARITHKSADQLRLSVGQTVYAQIKSVALID